MTRLFAISYSIARTVGEGFTVKPDPVLYRGRKYLIYEKTSCFSNSQRCQKGWSVILPVIFTFGLILLDPKFRYMWEAMAKGKAIRRLAIESKVQGKVQGKEAPVQERARKLFSENTPPPEETTFPPLKRKNSLKKEELISSSDEEEEETLAAPKEVSRISTPEEQNLEEEEVKIDSPDPKLSPVILEEKSEEDLTLPSPLKTSHKAIIEEEEVTLEMPQAGASGSVATSSAVPVEAPPEKKQGILNWVIVGGPQFTENGSQEQYQKIKTLIADHLNCKAIEVMPRDSLPDSAGVLVLIGGDRWRLPDVKALESIQKLKDKTGKEPLVVLFPSPSQARGEEFRKDISLGTHPKERLLFAPSLENQDHRALRIEKEFVDKIKNSF
jgi:hypothetical protein